MSLALAVRFRVWYSIQKIVLPPTWKYHNLIITWCHSALLEHWHLGFPLENLYLRIFLFAISPLRHNFSYCKSPKNVLGLKLIEWRLEFASTCKLSILVSFFNTFGLSCTIVQKKYFSRTMIHSCFQEQCYRSPTRPTFPVGGLSHIRFPFRWGFWILPTEARFQLSKARSSSTTSSYSKKKRLCGCSFLLQRTEHFWLTSFLFSGYTCLHFIVLPLFSVSVGSSHYHLNAVQSFPH